MLSLGSVYLHGKKPASAGSRINHSSCKNMLRNGRRDRGIRRETVWGKVKKTLSEKELNLSYEAISAAVKADVCQID